MSGMKSRTPKNRFHVLHSNRFNVVNGNPVVSGPAYTAGASAMKHDNLDPSVGYIPREREMKARPLPWEWPINAIWGSQRKGTMGNEGVEKKGVCPWQSDFCKGNRTNLVVSCFPADMLDQSGEVVHRQLPDRPICDT